MIGNWKTQLNKRKKIGMIMIDLSKAFDTLKHNLLVAKRKAYGVNLYAASFIKSYFTNSDLIKLGTHSVNEKEL